MKTDTALVEAAESLLREVNGIVGIAREGLIELVGVTNVRCLERHAADVEALLGVSAGPASAVGQEAIRHLEAVRQAIEAQKKCGYTLKMYPFDYGPAKLYQVILLEPIEKALLSSRYDPRTGV